MKKSRAARIILQKGAIITCIFLLAGFAWAGSASSGKAAWTPVKGSPKTVSASRSLPLLVDVGADKCVPCVLMAPILEELKKEYAGVFRVEFIDVWKKPDEARKYRVTGIPTQIFYDASGKELGRHMGFISKEGILKRFELLGVPLGKTSEK
jgi:thioredoxin 1